jgi:predicted esterase
MRLVLPFLLLTTLPFAQAREVVSLTWPTRHASPPPNLPMQTAEWLPAFRLALATLPESATVALSLSQPALLGLSPDAAAQLQPLVAKRYVTIASDAAYSKATSALPYCFSAQRPTHGRASLYIPDNTSAGTDVIVFLHGYGGSFLWYQHYLSEIFPQSIIIAPAYGIATASVPSEYITESIQAAERHLGFSLPRPKLVGLSAGGFSACRVFARRPDSFASLIILAAYPPSDSLSTLPRGHTLRFLAGQKDSFVLDGSWDQARRQLSARRVTAQFTTLPKADHFFLLTHPSETAAWLLH